MPLRFHSKRAPSAKQMEAEQASLNALANRELLMQELSDIDSAREWMNGWLTIGKRTINFLLPTEGWEDLPDKKVCFILRNIDWVKWAIKNNKHSTI